MGQDVWLQARCALEHFVIRDLFFEHGSDLIEHFRTDADLLYGMMSEMMRAKGFDHPYTREMFWVHPVETDQVTAVLLGFPLPEQAPACYMSMLLQDQVSGRKAYFTVEKDIEDTDPRIARWDAAQQYYRYGHCVLEKEQIIATILDIFSAPDMDLMAEESYTASIEES